jgi:hypothetical protein
MASWGWNRGSSHRRPRNSGCRVVSITVKSLSLSSSRAAVVVIIRSFGCPVVFHRLVVRLFHRLACAKTSFLATFSQNSEADIDIPDPFRLTVSYVLCASNVSDCEPPPPPPPVTTRSKESQHAKQSEFSLVSGCKENDPLNGRLRCVVRALRLQNFCLGVFAILRASK